MTEDERRIVVQAAKDHRYLHGGNRQVVQYVDTRQHWPSMRRLGAMDAPVQIKTAIVRFNSEGDVASVEEAP